MARATLSVKIRINDRNTLSLIPSWIPGKSAGQRGRLPDLTKPDHSFIDAQSQTLYYDIRMEPRDITVSSISLDGRSFPREVSVGP
jgi:hypothetical protein